MGLNDYSDYGSGSSLESCLSWGAAGPHDSHGFNKRWSDSPALRPLEKCTSLFDVLTKKSIDEVLQEFRMNGSDSPYEPEDERWTRPSDKLSGMGPSSAYVRQKSWPEPEATPTVRLPNKGPWASTAKEPIVPPPLTQLVSVPHVETQPMPHMDTITEEQVRVLNSLPSKALYSLLRELETDRDVESNRKKQECRFCLNNGERESYYRSHVLKDSFGRVRCPVLRAYCCVRCGARGDHAHTLKYCPLTPTHERIKSTAMMRSVRNTSQRRRAAALGDDLVLYGQAPPSVVRDAAQLDPLWAALEQKLSL